MALVWLWMVGSVGLMWGVGAVARAIARHGDARIGDEAEAWLHRQSQ